MAAAVGQKLSYSTRDAPVSTGLVRTTTVVTSCFCRPATKHGRKREREPKEKERAFIGNTTSGCCLPAPARVPKPHLCVMGITVALLCSHEYGNAFLFSNFFLPPHARFQAANATPKNGTLQVVCPSYGRTGTKSMKAALEVLGFGPCYHSEFLFLAVANRAVPEKPQ